MSFGEGNLHERVAKLEREKADLVRENTELHEHRHALESLLRDIWLTWKLLDEQGERPDRFHNGWKTFVDRMIALGIEA